MTTPYWLLHLYTLTNWGAHSGWGVLKGTRHTYNMYQQANKRYINLSDPRPFIEAALKPSSLSTLPDAITVVLSDASLQFGSNLISTCTVYKNAPKVHSTHKRHTIISAHC